MNEVVIFPDIEAALVEYLPALVDTEVVTRIPNPRPGKFVLLTRIGGSRRNLVSETAMVTVECWAPTEPEASDLGALTLGILHASEQSYVGPAWVRRVSEIGGLMNFPDPETGNPRYQFTVQINTRGKTVTVAPTQTTNEPSADTGEDNIKEENSE